MYSPTLHSLSLSLCVCVCVCAGAQIGSLYSRSSAGPGNWMSPTSDTPAAKTLLAQALPQQQMHSS
jgi:hypothetical protein